MNVPAAEATAPAPDATPGDTTVDSRFPLVADMPELASDASMLWLGVAMCGIGALCFLYAMFTAFDSGSHMLPMMFGFAFLALGRVVSSSGGKKHSTAMERAMDTVLDEHDISRDEIDADHELKWKKNPDGKLVIKLVEKQEKT